MSATKNAETRDAGMGEAWRLPPSEARAAAEAIIADEERRYERTPLAHRVYRCDRCGHETVTRGYGLPAGSRCFALVHDGRRRYTCGGLLEGGFVDGPH